MLLEERETKNFLKQL